MNKKVLLPIVGIGLILGSCGSDNSAPKAEATNTLDACDCAKGINQDGNDYAQYQECMDMRKKDAEFERVFTQCSYAVTEGKDTSEVNIPTKVVATPEMDIQGGEYNIDANRSSVVWRGRKLITKESHRGTIKIEDTYFRIIPGEVKAEIIMDMSSLIVDNTDDQSKQKLEGHLKSADFFDIENHPKAQFISTSHNRDGNKIFFTGDLKIKGKVQTQTIGLTIIEDDNNGFTAKGAFSFDRSKFDVRYGSGSFFDDLGDKVIDDNVFISFDLEGTVRR